MRLADVIQAGGYCAWSGEQRRPLTELGPYTVQGSPKAGTIGDSVFQVTRGAGSGQASGPVGLGGRLAFGRTGAR